MVLLFWWRLCGPSSVTAFEGPNGIALLVAPLWPSSVTAFEGPNGIALLVAPLWPSSVTAFGGPNGIALHRGWLCSSWSRQDIIRTEEIVTDVDVHNEATNSSENIAAEASNVYTSTNNLGRTTTNIRNNQQQQQYHQQQQHKFVDSELDREDDEENGGEDVDVIDKNTKIWPLEYSGHLKESA
uniref:Candidate secreted effector n=1 Tax=Meloidogyne incognita TaxID=6306 RepID=A0A914NR06_MELIC